MIHENNQLLAESKRFSDAAQIITTDIDLERLVQDRMRMTSFNDPVQTHLDQVRTIRPVEFEFIIPDENIPLLRLVERFPYVSSDSTQYDDHCYKAYHIQVHGLMIGKGLW